MFDRIFLVFVSRSWTLFFEANGCSLLMTTFFSFSFFEMHEG